MEKIYNELKSCLKTLLCFVIAIALIPVLLLSFICASFNNELANYVLSLKYPNLTISKSKKIRTLIDTPKNAGIFHFLLKVSGPCDFDNIKQYYEELLTDLRDKSGLLRFPKLRQQLVSCWGHYAWVNDTSGFNINNHVLLSTHRYRGRPISETNIEDFISELAQKYIPSDLPQWQVVVIPVSAEVEEQPRPPLPEHYYILVKVHHLIIAEEEDLHVSEMLLLRDPTRKSLLDWDELKPELRLQQQLSHFVRKPEHIQKLLQHIWKQLVSHWQKFIYEFESLETPDGTTSRLKITNLTTLLSLLLIVLVNVCLNYYRTMQLREKLRRRSSTYRSPAGRWQTLRALLRKEIDQRNLSWEVAGTAVRNSWQPLHIAKSIFMFLVRLQINHCLLLPYHLYMELLALRDIVLWDQTSHANTYCARLHTYIPLLIYAQLEFWKICYELIRAPRNLYDVLFVQPTRELNALHKKSYSGRKVISFTRAIDGQALRTRNQFNDGELRESDFSLACLAGALHDYFASFGDAPGMVNTTCRTVTKGYFTEHMGDKTDNIGGVVFLQLPLKAPGHAQACQLHNIIEQIRGQQIMIYLSSMGQTKYSLLTSLMPHVLTKIFINFFSSTFPITITEIYGTSSEFQTSWGQQVDNVLLFRPPQSKTCLSLNLHRFGDKYQLAIMADTQLAPDHARIARSFEYYMENHRLGTCTSYKAKTGTVSQEHRRWGCWCFRN